MTTPPRTVSVLGVLTVVALGVVLLIGSCEVPVPIVLEPENALERENKDPAINIDVERDGSVRVNGRLYPMSAVSAVVGPLYAGYESGVEGVSIRADEYVEYQVMDQLQQELREAGMLRVRFQTVDFQALRTSPDDPTLLDRGLAVALSAVRVVHEALEALAHRSDHTEVPVVAEGLPIVLPEQGGSLQVSPRSIMHLIVLPNGLVEIRRGESQWVQLITPEDVEAIWRQDVAQNPNLIAGVKTHWDAPYRYMVEVLDALHRAKAERISLKVLEKPVPPPDRPDDAPLSSATLPDSLFLERR